MNLNLGDDTEGVEHDWQHHENYIQEHKITLDEYGKFFRKTSAPMHLMKLESFLAQIDRVRTDEVTGVVNFR